MRTVTQPTLLKGRRPLAFGAAAALLAGALVSGTPPAGAVSSAAAPCPEAYPVEALAAGQELSGLTVDQGTTPEPFTASVIGVLEDGIAPDLDLILVETSSPAIDAAGGIWAGMSGSPVYAADGRLVGAVAYGLSFAPSPVAGITPAAAMRALLSDTGTTAAAPQVDLTAAMEKAIVSSGAATARQAAGGMSQLPVPVGVSGLRGSRLDQVKEMLQDQLPQARLHSAAPASGTAAAHELVAGGNVGTALSYGDLTAGAVGTVTAVCDAEALLFGHPFFFDGDTSLSAHSADALYVQRDDVFGSYKVANLGGVAGTVDQDRLAGLRATLGDGPPTSPVTSTVTSTATGRSRSGSTQIVRPDFVPILAAIHTLVNLDVVADRIGGGVVELNWQARGTRAGGAPWELVRREKVADQYDASIAAIFEILEPLEELQANRWEELTIDEVSVTGSITDEYLADRIFALQYKDPAGRWRTATEEEPITLVAGTRAQLRALLHPHRSTAIVTVPVSVTVPSGWAGAFGSLVVFGGGSGGGEGEGEFIVADHDDGGLDALLAELRAAPPGNSVIAELRLEQERRDGPPRSTERTGRSLTTDVAVGEIGVPVQVVPPRAARPGTVSAGAEWNLRTSLTSGPPQYSFTFGTSAHRPVMGDWNGDGIATPGQFRDGTWVLRATVGGTTSRTVTFGQAGDVPVVGDWNGDGKDDLGVYREGRFLLRDSATSGPPTREFAFGAVGDSPLAGDWDGDGDDTVGTFRRGTWQARDSLTAGAPTRQATFGTLPGDRPVAGDWNADGRDGIGVYRGGQWLLREFFSSGAPQRSFTFGTAPATPVVWQ